MDKNGICRTHGRCKKQVTKVTKFQSEDLMGGNHFGDNRLRKKDYIRMEVTKTGCEDVDWIH
jgi:hypothetical protein